MSTEENKELGPLGHEYNAGEVLLDRRTREQVRRFHATRGMETILKGLSDQNTAVMRLGAIILLEVHKDKKSE